MRIIPLTRGKFTIVDDEDHDWLIESSWCYICGKGNTGYARWNDEPMQGAILRRHDLWIEGLIADHCSGWGLDNRKANLRMVTLAENNTNKDSGRAIRQRPNGRWESRIGRKHIGDFDTRNEALMARAKAEADRGWLTMLERARLRSELFRDLDALVESGLISYAAGGPRLEDFFTCSMGSIDQQRTASNQAARRLEERIQEFCRNWERIQQEAERARQHATRPEVRRAAMKRLQEANRQLYFHKTHGWRVRLPDGEVSVPDRAAGLRLLDSSVPASPHVD